ncbi:50S ribosomal protein L24 [Candidatus Saccharibacteria bacterium]|nr:MAG: 50S ribosomal protein L24 [Candidatus Saccharibacteria bacterium]PID99591.1 MAG: 50S ribosomal protein L24 [Candidatus Saccharibacteria bacterium]
MYKIRLKKGDLVQVLSGKYKGKQGRVLATHAVENKVTVEGVNIVKKHQKPNKAHPQGGIVELTKPVPVSKVAIVDPSTKKPTRIGYALNKDGSKTRVYKSSGKEVKQEAPAKQTEAKQKETKVL